MFSRLGTHDAQTAIIFIFVMRTDPAFRHQLLRNFDTTWETGGDVTAHPPWIVDAVEGMEEECEGESGDVHEVFGCVFFD